MKNGDDKQREEFEKIREENMKLKMTINELTLKANRAGDLDSSLSIFERGKETSFACD